MSLLSCEAAAGRPGRSSQNAGEDAVLPQSPGLQPEECVPLPCSFERSQILASRERSLQNLFGLGYYQW